MKIVTEDSYIACDHGTGKVNIKSLQRFARINGAPMLLWIDPAFKPIAGCPNAGPTIKPCTLSMLPEKGKSDLVYVNYVPVALESIQGGTDGTPPGVTKYGVKKPGQDFVETES